MTEDESFLSYVFPILRYHDRITELTKEDITYFFDTKENTYNGFLINTGIEAADNLPTKRVLADYSFSEKAYEYLDKITALCETEGIELILIKSPGLYPYWYDEYDEQIQEYAEKNNLTYINFIDIQDEIGIDYTYDTYDSGIHLNLTGATKLSKYFANILVSSYELTDYREDEEVSQIYEEKLEAYYNAIEN